MRYMGSKSRIAKHIVPIIQSYIDENNISNYYEPFVGGANVIDKVVCQNRYGCDNNRYLIALFNNLDILDSFEPNVTRDHYNEVKESYRNNDNKFSDAYKGMIGFLCSYNGRFFDGGYVYLAKEKDKIRNEQDEAFRNLQKQISNLKDVKFSCCDYTKIEFEPNSVIYLDPPYMSTQTYSTGGFDSNKFWNWVREISKDNIVLISEQYAPDDFEVVWEKPITRTMDKSRIQSTEKLFIHKDC